MTGARPSWPPSGSYAQGYAAAVALLRDDERYRSWWSSTPESVRPTEPIRGHLADYLEILGPDGPDVTKPRQAQDSRSAVTNEAEVLDET